MSDFTLGTRPPYIEHVAAYDSFEDLQKIRSTAFSMRHPPKDLVIRPTYRAVLDLNIGLASPDARFVIRIRLGNKGYDDGAIGYVSAEYSVLYCILKKT